MNPERVRQALLELSHEFGERELVILGEGNTSARVSDETFVVKASGSSLRSLTDRQLTECRFDRLLPALDQEEISELEVERVLREASINPDALKPSVETFFHAYLLTLPEVHFVGHAHPIPVNQILCSPKAEIFAKRRQCPDEVVCCGPVSLLLPYQDPGLVLARRIRTGVEEFAAGYGKLPRVVLLENHGVITLGPTPEAVRAAMYMTVKAAAVFAGAQTLGPVRHLPEVEVHRIEHRLDEEYRRKMLSI
jgi:rhamnose utilization protein RhaD (predicted bifunctional aldolase and dehydrogenase)